jgi:chemotaxis protein methyltransferase CheR
MNAAAMPAPQDGVRAMALARTAGLRVREQDLEALLQWTTMRTRSLALQGIEQYGELLAEESAVGRQERERLLVRFSTDESYFFRDPGQFDLLATTLLPELIERRANERRLRIWSAGCANGEEPYSLAMLVDELSEQLAGWSVLILGTDISAAALEKARRGIYGDWSFRALDAVRKQRYFRRHGGQWQIDSRLRDRVTFCRGDLVRDRFPDADAGLADFDLILCRNVFIYLDAGAVAAISAKFAESLSEGGYLLTAHSELFGHDTAPLRVRMHPQSAVYQKVAPGEAPPALPEKEMAAEPLPQPRAARLPRIALPAKPAPERKPAIAPAPDASQLIESAWRHADRGRRDEAARECRRAIDAAPFDPRPYHLLALLAQERGEPAEAIALLKKAVYLDPSQVAASLELAALLAQAGEPEAARRTYQAARAALAKLPAEARVPPFGEATAAEALAYAERMLGALPV